MMKSILIGLIHMDLDVFNTLLQQALRFLLIFSFLLPFFLNSKSLLKLQVLLMLPSLLFLFSLLLFLSLYVIITKVWQAEIPKNACTYMLILSFTQLNT